MRFLRNAGKLVLGWPSAIGLCIDRLTMLARLLASGIRSCLYSFLDIRPSKRQIYFAGHVFGPFREVTGGMCMTEDVNVVD